jgi:hypothetical protein
VIREPKHLDHKNWDSSLARLENEHVKTLRQLTTYTSQADIVVLIDNSYVNTGENVGVFYDKFLIFSPRNFRVRFMKNLLKPIGGNRRIRTFL